MICSFQQRRDPNMREAITTSYEITVWTTVNRSVPMGETLGVGRVVGGVAMSVWEVVYEEVLRGSR